MGNPPFVYIDPIRSLDAIRPASTAPCCVAFSMDLSTEQNKGPTTVYHKKKVGSLYARTVSAYYCFSSSQ